MSEWFVPAVILFFLWALVAVAQPGKEKVPGAKFQVSGEIPDTRSLEPETCSARLPRDERQRIKRMLAPYGRRLAGSGGGKQ
jgi:hypothetical protein